MGILRRLREWREDKNGTLIGPNIDADSVDAGSVNTDQTDITNESLVLAKGDANVTGISAGTFESPSFGNIEKDERGEFANDGFTPDKTGWYLVTCHARTQTGNGSDGDRLEAVLQNSTDNTPVVSTQRNFAASAPSFTSYPKITAVVELEAGKTYKYQVKNRDSSFAIDSGRAYYNVRSMFR